MLRRVCDAGGGALRDPEERDRSFGRRRIDDAREVVTPPRGRQIRDVPIGHAAAALVVADESRVPRE